MNKNTTMPQVAGRPSIASTIPLGRIAPQGWLRDQLRLQADGITGHLEEIWPDVGADSGWLGGSGEDWERGPYYLDGLVPLAHVLSDEGLIARAQPWIEWILASQKVDGFFGPASNDDWWPRTVALKVLTQHADATGDERVKPFLQQYFRYQLKHLPQRPLRSWGRARGADNTLSVWWLHEQTGEEWLLQLVDLIDAQTIAWNDYLNEGLITGPARTFSHRTHGPNVAMGLKKGAVDALRDGNLDTHREQTEGAFANLDRWHGQAHGWFSGDEWLGGREATAGIETCQVVEMMFSTEVLARVFGDGVYGDRLESLAFNLLPASNDPRMLAHQYHQQANQVEVSVARREWSYSSDGANVFGLEPHFGCCTANLHQGWPKLVSHLWLRDADEGFRAVVYAPAVVNADVGGDDVTLTVTTDYPFDEAIAIDVATTRREPFPLRLRIPQWATEARLTVAGETVPVKPERGYVTVTRDWSSTGDVTLVLPMRARVLRRERQSATVRLGPLVMVLSPGERWIAVEDAHGLGEWEIHRRGSWNEALQDVDLSASWQIDRQPPASAPWSLTRTSAPVVLHASGARAPQWRMAGSQSDVPPASPVFERGTDDDLALVPYGCARLRITEFPVIGHWHDIDDHDDPASTQPH